MASNNSSLLKTIYVTNIEDEKEIIGKDGKFHYFYKIVNNINNKYYYGVHSTYNLNDNYIGSGIVLMCSYKKYGFDNFTKYVLCFFDDRKSLLEYERFIVNEELIKEEQCYNLVLGGNANTETKKCKSYLLHTTKNMIHINNTFKNKMVKINELEKYLKDGWILGQLQKSTKGKIIINKNNEKEIFIFQEDFDKYKKDGWVIGGKSRNKNKKSIFKNTIWVNNSNIQKRISKEELDNYLMEGWTIGTIQKTTKNYIRITNGIEDKNILPENQELLNFYLNNGWKRGTHVKRDYSAWVSKEGKSIMVNKKELDKYLSEGWERGRVEINDNKQSGKIAVHKDKIMTYIYKEDLDKYLSEGWERGGIRKNSR